MLVFLAWRMAFPPVMDDANPKPVVGRTRAVAGALGAAIGVFAGFLGVGPGFLMMPTLVMLGYTARTAAATNSVIVTLPSFSAFAAHVAEARLDWAMLLATSLAAVIGAQLGARFTARRVKSLTLSRVFAAALVALAVQRVLALMG